MLSKKRFRRHITIFTTDWRWFCGRCHRVASTQIDQHYHSQRKIIFCEHFRQLSHFTVSTFNWTRLNLHKSKVYLFWVPAKERKIILKLFPLVGALVDPKVNWRLREGIKERKKSFFSLNPKENVKFAELHQWSVGRCCGFVESLFPARSPNRLVFNVFFQLLSDGRL